MYQVPVKMEAHTIIFLLIVASAYAGNDKSCPIVEPVANIDTQKLLGTWYEQTRYKNYLHLLERCVQPAFSIENDQLMFSISGVIDNKEVSFKEIVRPASNGTGLLWLQPEAYKGSDGKAEVPVSIVAVDYDKYLIMYECTYDADIEDYRDYLWILSRSKAYEGETKAFVDNFLDSTPFVDKSKLIWQDFSQHSC